MKLQAHCWYWFSVGISFLTILLCRQMRVNPETCYQWIRTMIIENCSTLVPFSLSHGPDPHSYDVYLNPYSIHHRSTSNRLPCHKSDVCYVNIFKPFISRSLSSAHKCDIKWVRVNIMTLNDRALVNWHPNICVHLDDTGLHLQPLR